MGGCQNHGPLVGLLNTRCRIVVGTQKGTIVLTTTNVFTMAHRTEALTCRLVRTGQRPELAFLGASRQTPG